MPNPFASGVELPLIAILRGLKPADAAQVGRMLYAEGFRFLEVPLNREGAIAAISELARSVARDAYVGAGTVTTPQQVKAVAEVGGKLIISANTDVQVISVTRELGLWSLPGAATPSEAFTAVQAGAHAIKAFPAEMVSPAVLRAWRSVLSPDLAIYPVGGIEGPDMAAYVKAGASGFGLGSALFTPKLSVSEIRVRAANLISAWRLANNED
jgi:2-dehydro-3-deoxyphosphogalactonate aldolase